MAETFFDVISAVLLIGGALMSLAAAVGLLRFPDLMSRMHAATKPQVLGLLLLLAAIAVQLRSWAVLPILVLCWIFQLLTVPVSAHMVGRAGYRTKHLRRDLLSLDELDEVVERAAHSQDTPAEEDSQKHDDPVEDGRSGTPGAPEKQESTSPRGDAPGASGTKA